MSLLDVLVEDSCRLVVECVERDLTEELPKMGRMADRIMRLCTSRNLRLRVDGRSSVYVNGPGNARLIMKTDGRCYVSGVFPFYILDGLDSGNRQPHRGGVRPIKASQEHIAERIVDYFACAIAGAQPSTVDGVSVKPPKTIPEDMLWIGAYHRRYDVREMETSHLVNALAFAARKMLEPTCWLEGRHVGNVAAELERRRQPRPRRRSRMGFLTGLYWGARMGLLAPDF